MSRGDETFLYGTNDLMLEYNKNEIQYYQVIRVVSSRFPIRDLLYLDYS